MLKKPYLDEVSRLFIENLEIEMPLFEMTPENARGFLKNLQKKYYKHIEGSVEDIEIFDVNVGNISVKLVRPANFKGETLPLAVYCHGGGWVMGDFEDYEMVIKTISNRTNCAVAFVNYSRAPEFQYPDALKEICGTIEYFKQNSGEHNIFPERIALVGDSAGGTLAIAAAMQMKDKISFLALIYPVTNIKMNSDSYHEFKNGPWLSKKAMEWFWDSYIPCKDSRKEIYASPLDAERDNLQGLPPTLVITAENDVLRDEGEEFARKLIDAGVECASVRINNTFHDFILLNALKNSMATKAGYKILCQFLKYELNK